MGRNFLWGALAIFVLGCGSGEDREFSNPGDSGAGTGGGSSGGSSGSGASAGAAGSSGTGASGTTGGAGGATGGAGGATGGTAGASGGATGGAGGATGGTGGAQACDSATTQCAPDVPAGWAGPVAFYNGATAAPSCPGAYPTVGAKAHSGFKPGSASCSCSCDPATGIACNGSAKVESIGTVTLACTLILPGQGTVIWSGNSSSCTHPSASVGATGKVRLLPPTPSSSGTCQAKANHTLPTPTWTSETQICAGASAPSGTCGSGQTCVQKTFAPYQLCVHRPGAFSCPPGYTKKHSTHENFTDSRACSTCTCGASTDAKCGGKVDFVSGCSGIVALNSSISSCGVASPDPIGTNQYGTYKPAPSGTCPSSSPTLSGTATATGETTVCCLP
ncbi:MAG: hypothetical protein R3B13_14695 [Polyangiaceae bacterium]